ncbi:MAG: ammonium transporter [Actinobacteria bacterium]|nr:ammonium transporter [Actinomycetota bacterium]
MRRGLVTSGVFLATLSVGTPAFAQGGGDVATVQFNLDVVFFMLAIVLVFFMQAGFALLESGLSSSKNTANILMKNMADMMFGMPAYFLVGFGLMYGASVAGLIGSDTFALAPGSYTDGIAADPFVAADFMYQAVFAATAATIVSGAVAGRMRFSGYIWLSVAMTVLIYPVVGHWKWGGGWLDALGFYDFAGSTIVHLTGGVAGLTAAALLGPRLGKFSRDGRAHAMPGHAAPLTVLGTLVLFFGWFGFNGGSVLAADGALLGPVLLTTALAGCAGGVSSLLYTWVRFGKPDMSMTCNGVLAGLVGITAGADQVGPIAALGVGLAAGVLVVLSVAAVDRLRVDDAVGAFSVHGTCGILGTWWVGLFANTADNVGLWHGGGLGLLGSQVVGTVAVTAFVGSATALVVTALKAAGALRVGEDEEIEGLDLHEHGMYGYPEFAVGPQTYGGAAHTNAPSGAAGHAGSARAPAGRE